MEPDRKSMQTGLYIVFEGPAGVGKTTQLEELARRIQSAGLPVTTMNDESARTSAEGEAIHALLGKSNKHLNERTKTLLESAARAQSLDTIKHITGQGIICLVDQNFLSTLANDFYGPGTQTDYPNFAALIEYSAAEFEPDVCIVLDAPVPTLRLRLNNRGSNKAINTPDDSMLERIRAGYLWEAKQRDLPVVFATETVGDIADEVWGIVSERLANRYRSTSVSTPETVPHEPPLDLPMQASIEPVEPAFVVPDTLSAEMQTSYKITIEQLLANKTTITESLTAYISGTGTAIEEANAQAKQVTQLLSPLANLKPAVQILNAPTPSDTLKTVLRSLPQNHTEPNSELVSLVDFWPKNEFQLLSYIAYESSSLPLAAVQDRVTSWSYEQKLSFFETYLAEPHVSPALSQAIYSFDVFAAFADITDLLNKAGQTVHAWQYLTPRYGFVTPAIIEDAGLSDAWSDSFDLSLQLFSRLQQAGHHTEAQLATLGGHQQRCLVNLTANQIIKTPADNAVTQKIHELCQDVHPTLFSRLG